jgi:hypothetical protein
MYGFILVVGQIGHDDTGAAPVARATSTLNAWLVIDARRRILYDTREVLSSSTTREIDNGTLRRHVVAKVNDPGITHEPPGLGFPLRGVDDGRAFFAYSTSSSWRPHSEERANARPYSRRPRERPSRRTRRSAFSTHRGDRRDTGGTRGVPRINYVNGVFSLWLNASWALR